MKAINPIIDSPNHTPEHTSKVPQYVLDARKPDKNEIQRLAIQAGMKIKKIKVSKTKISKQKTMTHKKVSSKHFLKFIDRERPKSLKSSLEVTRSSSIGKMGDIAIRNFRNLIELAKSASRNENLPMADLFYELKELKEKEIGLIYNYIAKQK